MPRWRAEAAAWLVSSIGERKPIEKVSHPAAEARHRGDHEARVDAPGEVGADRDVAAQGELHRVEEELLEFLDGLGVGL